MESSASTASTVSLRAGREKSSPFPISGATKWRDVENVIASTVLANAPRTDIKVSLPPESEAASAASKFSSISSNPLDGALHGLGKKQILVTFDQLSSKLRRLLNKDEKVTKEACALMDLVDNGARLNLEKITGVSQQYNKHAKAQQKEMKKNRKIATNIAFDREGGTINGGPERTFYKIIMKRSVSKNTTKDGTTMGEMQHKYTHEYTDGKDKRRSEAVQRLQRANPYITHQELENYLEKERKINDCGGRGASFLVRAYDVETVPIMHDGSRVVKTKKYQIRYPVSVVDPLVALVMRELGEDAVEKLKKQKRLTRRSAMQALEQVRKDIENDVLNTQRTGSQRRSKTLRSTCHSAADETSKTQSKSPSIAAEDLERLVQGETVDQLIDDAADLLDAIGDASDHLPSASEVDRYAKKRKAAPRQGKNKAPKSPAPKPSGPLVTQVVELDS